MSLTRARQLSYLIALGLLLLLWTALGDSSAVEAPYVGF